MQKLMDLVTEYIAVRSQRLELEKEVAEVKAGREASLKSSILALMSAEGLKSANIEGVGRIVSVEKEHYEIIDKEALLYQTLAGLVTAAQTNHPLEDGLLLQMRVSKEHLEAALAAYVDIHNVTLEDAMTIFGVKKASENNLSFTKA